MRRLLLVAACLSVASFAYAQPPIAPNDNGVTAGTVRDGRLTLRLYAGVGKWRPEGDSGPAVVVQAFGEEGRALQTPGPLIRVPLGTTVDVTVRNALDVPLELHGFTTRPAASDEPTVIGAGESRRLTFAAGAAGTYHYWGTTTRSPLPLRFDAETQLSGAFIVHEPGAPADKVFVMTYWSPEPPGPLAPVGPRLVYVINGRAWPHTSRLTYGAGDKVQWRIINLTEAAHPMHLHGFYFHVHSTGDGLKESPLPPGDSREVVTELVPVGGTMRMTWTAEREGNWLFHCHIVGHIAPDLTVATSADETPHGTHDPTGMGGLVVGITVRAAADTAHRAPAVPRRQLTLAMKTIAKRFDDEVGYGFVLDRDTSARTPGPPLILTRGEPVEITLQNDLPEPTTIHWHGIELESFFDGVAHFSGTSGSLTPEIPPGGAFQVRFTPPRSGTFMYHTHAHDERVLANGLYGALIVLEPGETFDPATDHVLILGLNGNERERTGKPDGILLNGELSPSITLKQGTPNRLRLVNITANNAALTFLLMRQVELASWKPLAKDGAGVPAAQQLSVPARQLVSVGETYDFEVTPEQGLYWIEVRRGNGAFLIQAPVVLAR